MTTLAISSLFPTPEQPNHGIFVLNRINAMIKHSGEDVVVLNPIPTSPIHKILPRYRAQQSCPDTTTNLSIQHIYHPKYLSIPGLFKDREHSSAIACILPLIENLHKKHSFERIDVHWTYPDLPLGLFVAKKLGIPCYLTLRGMEAFYYNEKDNRSNIIAKCISKADGIISLSQEMSSFATLISNLKKTPTIIRNGVDTKTFSYTDKKSSRDTLDINQKETMLLGVGALIERKGFHHIISALRQISSQLQDKTLHYHILGAPGMEGDFQKSLEQLASQVRSDNIKITFHGAVNNSQLPLWYCAADIFCLSSFNEGSPNVLAEALSCGCPSVASDVGAVSDIILSEDNLGLTLPCQSSASNKNAGNIWADTILKALSIDFDRSLQSSAMSKYTWEWCAKKAYEAIK
jgi:teichuronic acid biosynthesis glycosyltransferase TuaC